MKNIFPILLLFLVIGCKTSKNNSKSITITNNQVKDIVSYLASDDLKGRDTGSEGINMSAKFIEEKFKTYGLKPYFNSYRDNFKVDSLDAFNIVGFLEGKDVILKDEVIIIGAHYDHIGYKTKIVENDSIANGANDNASGTAAVIAMANYFSEKKNNKRSLMFVLFSAEEKGLLGSKHLAEKLKLQNIDLYTMVNIEMIGVPFKDRDYEAFVTGFDLSNMAAKMNEYVGSNLIGFSDVAKKYNLFRASDNYSFYNEFKLPCQTISSCDLSNYDYYHHVDDETEKMDYEHMASLINKIIPAIETMSNTSTKEIKMHE
ncbi:MAG: M20/M25/M40 family metallo-hydrolase [Bacteroidetes bacterium]|nr:M20/M25/M40 family metallo-hydrolase [Bacteroidota bacterium]